MAPRDLRELLSASRALEGALQVKIYVRAFWQSLKIFPVNIYWRLPFARWIAPRCWRLISWLLWSRCRGCSIKEWIVCHKMHEIWLHSGRLLLLLWLLQLLRLLRLRWLRSWLLVGLSLLCRCLHEIGTHVNACIAGWCC